MQRSRPLYVSRAEAYQGRRLAVAATVFPFKASGREKVQVIDRLCGFESVSCTEPVAILVFFPAIISKLLWDSGPNGDGNCRVTVSSRFPWIGVKLTRAIEEPSSVFNDRPSYAAAPAPGVFATDFGLLSISTINGNVPRNLGTMPALVHLDMNLSRAWKIGRNRLDSSRTLTLNVRSANLLNHTNATAVSSVVSSPVFSQPVAAESARRLEFGARFAF